MRVVAVAIRNVLYLCTVLICSFVLTANSFAAPPNAPRPGAQINDTTDDLGPRPASPEYLGGAPKDPGPKEYDCPAGEAYLSSYCVRVSNRSIEQWRPGSRQNSVKLWRTGSKEWNDFWLGDYDITPINDRESEICGCFRDTGRRGCFAPETEITMADGSTREAQNIAAGDYVLNPGTGKAAKVLRVIEGPEALPLVEIGYDSVRLRITNGHPVPVYSNVQVGLAALRTGQSDRKVQLKRAADLEIGDVIQTAGGEFRELSYLNKNTEVEEGQYVVNLILEAENDSTEQHLVVSDGIVTGDMVLQLKIAARDSL